MALAIFHINQGLNSMTVGILFKTCRFLSFFIQNEAMRTLFLVGKLDNGYMLVYRNNLSDLTTSSESGRLITHLKLAI